MMDEFQLILGEALEEGMDDDEAVVAQLHEDGYQVYDAAIEVDDAVVSYFGRSPSGSLGPSLTIAGRVTLPTMAGGRSWNRKADGTHRRIAQGPPDGVAAGDTDYPERMADGSEWYDWRFCCAAESWY